jgi:hypothetical protein
MKMTLGSAMRLGALCAVALAGTALFAQDDAPKGLSLGGAAFIESYKSGGIAELGFSLAERESVSVRDYLVFTGSWLRLEDGRDYGILEFSDKLVVGGNFAGPFRAYGFIEGGFGLFAGDSLDGTAAKAFFAAPFFCELKAGGGLELMLNPRQTYYVEYGGGYGTSTEGAPFAGNNALESGFALIRVGSRLYF